MFIYIMYICVYLFPRVATRSIPRMTGWYKLDRLLRVRGLGVRHNSLVSDSHSASPRDNWKLVSYWRASEESDTLLVVVQWKTRYVYTYIYIYTYIYYIGA